MRSVLCFLVMYVMNASLSIFCNASYGSFYFAGPCCWRYLFHGGKNQPCSFQFIFLNAFRLELFLFAWLFESSAFFVCPKDNRVQIIVEISLMSTLYQCHSPNKWIGLVCLYHECSLKLHEITQSNLNLCPFKRILAKTEIRTCP